MTCHACPALGLTSGSWSVGKLTGTHMDWARDVREIQAKESASRCDRTTDEWLFEWATIERSLTRKRSSQRSTKLCARHSMTEQGMRTFTRGCIGPPQVHRGEFLTETATEQRFLGMSLAVSRALYETSRAHFPGAFSAGRTASHRRIQPAGHRKTDPARRLLQTRRRPDWTAGNACTLMRLQIQLQHR